MNIFRTNKVTPDPTATNAPQPSSAGEHVIFKGISHLYFKYLWMHTAHVYLVHYLIYIYIYNEKLNLLSPPGKGGGGHSKLSKPLFSFAFSLEASLTPRNQTAHLLFFHYSFCCRQANSFLYWIGTLILQCCKASDSNLHYSHYSSAFVGHIPGCYSDYRQGV